MANVRTLRQATEDVGGSIAIEFALLAPLFLLMLIGVVGAGLALAISSGVQQLASEAARASVAGLSDAERSQIAQTFVATHVDAYPFLQPQHLSVATSSLIAPTAAFRVSIVYDLSSQTAAFTSLLPFMPSQVQRSAVVSVGTSL